MRAGRYEIREILGEGGMGVVYRAWDPVLNGDVSLKTIRDPQNKQALDLFERERAILASIAHPNIVTILHLGDIEEAGGARPYFVMPLLRGTTLQQLIQDSSVRLTIERSIHIVTQVCRGLQAAHDHGIVHRDIKPSNIFVLPDDSVVVIDFGMAHFTNHQSTTGMKGTPSYMSPEQIAMKHPTPQSDQFSLAVVCYQMLARQHPFFASSQEDLRIKITSVIPQPISQFNSVVNSGICQVVHRALAKDPLHRYSSVREFGELLQKALRGEFVETQGDKRLFARLKDARNAFEMGDIEEAEEIADELAAQSLNPEVAEFRKFLYERRRAITITQLLDKARKHFEQGKYSRAIKHVQEILDLDPDNTEAFTLKGAIDGKRSETQIADWYQLATEHVDNRSFQNAREALEKVLDIRPSDIRAKLLLGEVERQEQEHNRLREEHQRAYESALESYQRGDLNSAVRKLEHVLDIDRRAGHRIFQDQGVACQHFYEEVRSKRDQLLSKDSEARRHIQNGNLAAARVVVQEVLQAFPDNVLFRVLQDDIIDAERQELSAFQAKVEKDVASEPDFARKVSILEEARNRYPLEGRFQQALQQVRTRRDLVDSIAGQARTLEEQRQFSDALGKWETMRSIHPQYPGLEIEIDRLRRRREQQARSDIKGQRIAQVDQALAVHNHARAAALIGDALAEFPADSELVALAAQIEASEAKASDAKYKSERGRQLYDAGDADTALALLREAHQAAPQNASIRSALLDVLLREAGARIDKDWATAAPLVTEALIMDPGSALAKSLDTLIRDRRQSDEVSAGLAVSRSFQAKGSIPEALQEVNGLMQKYPREARLIQFRTILTDSLTPRERVDLRAADLEEVRKLEAQSKETSDPHELDSIFQKTQKFSAYENDAAFRDPLSAIEERLAAKTEIFAVPPPPHFLSPEGWDAPEPPLATDEPGSEINGTGQTAGGSGRLKVVLAGIGMFLVMVLVFAFIQWILGNGKNPKGPVTPITAGAQKISVSGADIADCKIYRGDADVTPMYSSGFSPGEYKLVATRPGFEKFEAPFTIEVGKPPPGEIVVHWAPLPTEVKVILASRSGEVQIDGASQLFDSSLEVRMQWKKGAHAFGWRRLPGDVFEVTFDVKDEEVTMQPLVLQGRDLTGLVVICSNDQLSYQAINASPGVIRKIGNVETQLPAAGSFPFKAGSSVSFKTVSGGFPLGDYATTENGGSAVFIRLIPIAPRAPVNPSGSKPPAREVPRETGPVVQPEPAPVKPQPSPTPPAELDAPEKLKNRRKEAPKL